MDYNKEDGVLVTKTKLARRLVRLGYKIKDLPPRRLKDGTIDHSRTAYVFFYTDDINKVIDIYKND